MFNKSFCGLLFCLFVIIESKKDSCKDGKENVVRIVDTSKGKGLIKFDNVQILTYDARKKPVCFEEEGIIALPGFIRISSGEMKVSQPINPKSTLWIDLTAEMNSFFIGKICERGESQVSIMPNDFCFYNVCEYLGERCRHLQKVGKVQLPELFPQLIPLAASFSQFDGEWRLEAVLRQDENFLASARATPLKGVDSWHIIRVDQEEDEEELKKAIKEDL